MNENLRLSPQTLSLYVITFKMNEKKEKKNGEKTNSFSLLFNLSNKLN